MHSLPRGRLEAGSVQGAVLKCSLRGFHTRLFVLLLLRVLFDWSVVCQEDAEVVLPELQPLLPVHSGSCLGLAIGQRGLSACLLGA